MEFFEGFKKIHRLRREIIITEKIDGTNAQIYIGQDRYPYGEFLVGSRTRWITPESDNHGFAKWAIENKQELINLGPGRHFGEWWGSNIQRKYGIQEKRFSLFNTSIWNDSIVRPSCCRVVPVLYQGIWTPNIVEDCIQFLREFGSVAAPGFKNPEGIVIYHVPSGISFKRTLENDEKGKENA